MKKPSIYLLIFLFYTVTSGCDSIRRKTKQVADKAGNKVAEKKEDLFDKLIPRFDAYTPDTKYNRKRFRQFFGIEPTPDVKDLYCHADEFGIDHSYQFSFSCDTSTITKINTRLNLTKAEQPETYSSGLWHNFSWWDSTTISNITPYYKKGEHETYYYLWFDEQKRKAYYFTFDL